LVRLGSSRPAPTEVPADGPLCTLLVGATAAWTRGLPALRTRGLLARPQDARGGMNAWARGRMRSAAWAVRGDRVS